MRAVHYLGSERSCRDASALFLRARSAEALAAIGNDSSPASALLRARCQLRLGDAGSAAASLRRTDVSSSPAHIAGEYHVLFGASLARIGKRSEANEHFASAQVIASRTGGALQVELALQIALDAWNSRDVRRAEDTVHRALDVIRIDADPYPRSFNVLQAELVELLSLVAGVGEDYVRQAELLVEAWRLANDASRHEADISLQASILRNLAPLVWDLHLVEESEILRYAAAAIQWTPEIATARYAIHRALAWHAALEGHHVAALARFRECVELAPSNPWRLASTLDRALLAAEMRQEIILQEEMLSARALARTVQWQRVFGEETAALLDLAVATSRSDAGLAREWLTVYQSSTNNPVPGPDRRRRASELDACGAVLLAGGHEADALVARRTALTIWEELNFGWRAARTATELARLSDTPADRTIAKRLSQRFRKSWLRDRVVKIR